MRLVYTLVYLSQFDLDIRYYLGHLNIVLDTLLYLDVTLEENISYNNELDKILFSLEVVINPEFKQKLINRFQEDPKFTRALSNLGVKKDDRVIELLKDNASFQIKDSLLYYIINSQF